MSFDLPKIDFIKCGLHVTENEVSELDLQDCGDELYEALSTVGFAYLSNHGIDRNIIEQAKEAAEQFYSLPLEEKMLFEQPGLVLSYDSLGRSRLHLQQVDHFEGFRTGGEAYFDESVPWPNVPEMKKCFSKFADASAKLTLRLLKVLGHGMKLKDRDYFCKVHSLMNRKGNYSIVKSMRYPPICGDDEATENRIGEHADKTTLTLRFQDGIGGLQVKDLQNNFVDVPPVPGAIMIMVGETLEAWTRKQLKAARHKVSPPPDSTLRNQVRRSLMYFAQGNKYTLMKKLVFEDGVDNESYYEADENIMTVGEHALKCLAKVHKHFR